MSRAVLEAGARLGADDHVGLLAFERHLGSGGRDDADFGRCLEQQTNFANSYFPTANDDDFAILKIIDVIQPATSAARGSDEYVH